MSFVITVDLLVWVFQVVYPLPIYHSRHLIVTPFWSSYRHTFLVIFSLLILFMIFLKSTRIISFLSALIPFDSFIDCVLSGGGDSCSGHPLPPPHPLPHPPCGIQSSSQVPPSIRPFHQGKGWRWKRWKRWKRGRRGCGE